MEQRSKTEKVMIQEMYSASQEQKQTNTLIKLALFGDEKAGIEGLVKGHKKHEDQIRENKNDIQQYKNDRKVAVSLATLLSGMTAFIIKIWK